MHPSADNTKKAIALIREAKEKVSDLLADTPDFKTQANHVFETLANGLAFAIGEKVSLSGRGRSEKVQQPAQRTIMGVPVPEEKPITQRVQEAQPSLNEVDKFRTEIDRAYAAFGRMSNKEILNNLSDLEIRGVAKRAGLQVTKTEPARITDSFVTEIKNAIQEKADAEAAQKEAEELTRKLKEGPASPDAAAMSAEQDAATETQATGPNAEAAQKEAPTPKTTGKKKDEQK